MVLFCHLTGKFWKLGRSIYHILPFCPGVFPDFSIFTRPFHSAPQPRIYVTYNTTQGAASRPHFFRAAKPRIYVVRQPHKIGVHPGRRGRGLPGPGLWGPYRSCKGAASAGHKNSRLIWATKELHLRRTKIFWVGVKEFYFLNEKKNDWISKIFDYFYRNFTANLAPRNFLFESRHIKSTFRKKP